MKKLIKVISSCDECCFYDSNGKCNQLNTYNYKAKFLPDCPLDDILEDAKEPTNKQEQADAEIKCSKCLSFEINWHTNFCGECGRDLRTT